MKKYVISVFLFLTFSCANPYTKYNGWIGTGYEDRSLSNNKFEITYKGNGYTSRSTLIQYNDRRASELCPRGYNKISENLDMIGGVGGGTMLAYPELRTVIECK